jgi:hypothetical protein
VEHYVNYHHRQQCCALHSHISRYIHDNTLGQQYHYYYYHILLRSILGPCGPSMCFLCSLFFPPYSRFPLGTTFCLAYDFLVCFLACGQQYRIISVYTTKSSSILPFTLIACTNNDNLRSHSSFNYLLIPKVLVAYTAG